MTPPQEWTADHVRSLVAAGETLDVEFKGEQGQALNDKDLVLAVACLANRVSPKPGVLLVGVEDDGCVTGARARHPGGTDPRKVEALVGSRTRPPTSVHASIAVVDAVEVLVIEVPPATEVVSTTDGTQLRRTFDEQGRPRCLPMALHEAQGLQASRGRLDPSAYIVPGARWSDLDPLEIERFRRFVRESGPRGDVSLVDLPDRELLAALRATEGEGICLLGLLLFGARSALERLTPAHEVAFQVLVGPELVVEVNDFFRDPLLRVVEELLLRFRARNREQEVMVGMHRVPVPTYSERAFREALANALIHRDYHRLGAVHVQWRPDELRISNPGGFPEGVRLDNLLVTEPRPRNPRLADAFKRAGLVERTARGIDTIFLEQLRVGRPAPSYAGSSASDVVLALPGGEANLGFVRFVVERSRAGHALGLDELLVLNRLQLDRQTTTAEVAGLIQRPAAEARRVLERLVEDGLVEARGIKKGRTYHLSASVYRALGNNAGYVRQRGFAPLQHESMILSYVEANGSITRSQASELCQLSGDQAYRLLNRLVQAGSLQRLGNRRTARYEPVRRSTV